MAFEIDEVALRVQAEEFLETIVEAVINISRRAKGKPSLNDRIEMPEKKTDGDHLAEWITTNQKRLLELEETVRRLKLQVCRSHSRIVPS